MTISASAVARVLGVSTEFVDLRGGNVLFLPQRIAVVGQGNSATTYDTTKKQFTSAQKVGETYGFGSPLHLAARQLLPANGDGVGTLPVTIYPLAEDGSAIAATGSVGATGTATESGSFRVIVGGVPSDPITVQDGDAGADLDTDIKAAIDAVVASPVTTVVNAGTVDLTSKFKGESANDISIEIDGEIAGLTFAVTSMSSGATNPDVQPALDQVGDVWETMVINCLNIDDTTALDKYKTFGEGRWGETVKKPLVVFTGNNADTVSSATSVTSGRTADRVNSQLVAPGSRDLPLAIAARQVARIAVRAQNNPPRDYAGLQATGIEPGTDAEQWTFAQRDQAVKAGSSTVEVNDGVVEISDVVTMYAPDGETPPAYRYVVDIVRLQNIIYNLNLRFATDEWKGAPLIPDSDPTINPDAKKPKSAVAVLSELTGSLGLNAIISDPDYTRANTSASINSGNPNRLDITYPVKLSGNTGILDVGLKFGFFFGGQG